MKQPDKNSSPHKENKKVHPEKYDKQKEVREDENNSIYEEANDKSAYPYKHPEDKQYKSQPEFIDRNNDSKDKS
jgi:hypothetical protein